MPKSDLNVALKGLDDLFSTEETDRKNSGSRCSRFPSKNCFLSKTTPLRF